MAGHSQFIIFDRSLIISIMGHWDANSLTSVSIVALTFFFFLTILMVIYELIIIIHK